VPKTCPTEVGELMGQSCGAGLGPSIDRCRCGKLSEAWLQCTRMACLDSTNGIMEDGRITIVPP
jgi:hypothetical protein